MNPKTSSSRNNTVAGEQSVASSSLKRAFKHLLTGLFSVCTIAFAQGQTSERETVNQSIQWTSVNSNIKLHEKYGLTVDGQFRWAEGQTMQNQVRAGFEIYVTKKLAIVPVHYSYIWNYLYGKQPAAYANDEHRIAQQITYKHGFSRVAFSHRIRTEERFLQVHSKDVNDEVVDRGFINKQFRVRYRALLNIPINNKKMMAKTLYLSIWDEFFVSRGKAVTYDAPDQNRIFVGPGYQITKDIAIQGGYLYQMLIKANGAKQENNTGVLLQLNYNFDLSKKVSQ